MSRNSKVLFFNCNNYNSLILCVGLLRDLGSHKNMHTCIQISYDEEFPQYISGKRAFNETNYLLKKIANFPFEYDLVVIKGLGVLHPNYWGLASSIGAALGVKSVGITNNLLKGMNFRQKESLLNKNLRIAKLIDNNLILGLKITPIETNRSYYISKGWLIDDDELVSIAINLFENKHYMPGLSQLKAFFSEIKNLVKNKKR